MIWLNLTESGIPVVDAGGPVLLLDDVKQLSLNLRGCGPVLRSRMQARLNHPPQLRLGTPWRFTQIIWEGNLQRQAERFSTEDHGQPWTQVYSCNC